MRSLSVTACVLLSLSAAFAQSDLGSITGVITAPSGFAGAPVRARHIESGGVFRVEIQEFICNENNKYRL